MIKICFYPFTYLKYSFFHSCLPFYMALISLSTIHVSIYPAPNSSNFTISYIKKYLSTLSFWVSVTDVFISADAEAEVSILWPPDETNQLIGKDPDAGKDWGQEKREAKDESVGWCHWLNRHELEQALGAGEGQGSLVCCSPWGHRFRHDLVTEQQQQYFLVQRCSCNFTIIISLTTLHVGCQFPNQGWNLHALQ